MFHTRVLFSLVVGYWLCLMSEMGVVPPRKPLRSHITDGNKSFQVQNNASELDCSQFKDDFDILRQLPFPVVINPTTDEDYDYSTANLNEEKSFVKNITIRYENTVPLSVFCLSNLDMLHIETTPFQNGIVPDALANLKTLRTLLLYNTPIKKITEQLRTLTNLDMIQILNCSLTYLPDLTNLRELDVLDAVCNNISRIDGLPGVRMLDLTINQLTEIPILENPENLEFLGISYNPLKNALPILLYKNLSILFLDYTTLTFIPPVIDKLRKLAYLDLSGNKLTHLPTSILDLPQLEWFNVSKNLFSSNNIQSIKKAFQKSHPKLELFI